MPDLTDTELELALNGEYSTVGATLRLALEVKQLRSVRRITAERTREILREVASKTLSGLSSMWRGSLVEALVAQGAEQLVMPLPTLSEQERAALAKARDFLDFNVDEGVDRLCVDVLDRLLVALRSDAVADAERVAEQRSLDQACYQEVKRERDVALAECARLRLAAAEQHSLDQACYQEVKHERDAALAECARLRAPLASESTVGRASDTALELIAGARRHDLEMAALEGEGRGPWRVVSATGKRFQQGLQHYVTAIPTDHECWRGDDMTSWSRLGIWTSEGTTELAFAEGIAWLRNHARPLADALEEALRERDAALAAWARPHAEPVRAPGPVPMRLDTHWGTIADPATAQDVEQTVMGLTEVGRAFVVLNNGPVVEETYVQAAGTVAEGFIIERRDGRAGDHYRGDRCLSAAELGVALVGYLRGSSDWDHGITWHRVRVDQDTPSA